MCKCDTHPQVLIKHSAGRYKSCSLVEYAEQSRKYGSPVSVVSVCARNVPPDLGVAATATSGFWPRALTNAACSSDNRPLPMAPVVTVSTNNWLSSLICTWRVMVCALQHLVSDGSPVYEWHAALHR